MAPGLCAVLCAGACPRPGAKATPGAPSPLGTPPSSHAHHARTAAHSALQGSRFVPGGSDAQRGSAGRSVNSIAATMYRPTRVAATDACCFGKLSQHLTIQCHRRARRRARPRCILACAGGPFSPAWTASSIPQRYRAATPAGAPRRPLPVDSIRALHGRGAFRVLAEVMNQYAGLAPSDPRLEPIWALAEELDIPVGVHVGGGGPGEPYSGSPEFRARLQSALTLEVLVRNEAAPLLMNAYRHGRPP